MTIEQFKQSHNFSLNEERYQGGKITDTENIEFIDPVMWATNDHFVSVCKWMYPERKVYAKILHITSGNHTMDSAHSVGKAIDEVIVGLTLFEAITIALSIRQNHGPSGLGFYPYSKPIFIHFDQKDWNRDVTRTTVWYRNVDGEYISNTHRPDEVYEELYNCFDLKMR